jgi:hypothetical protein
MGILTNIWYFPLFSLRPIACALLLFNYCSNSLAGLPGLSEKDVLQRCYTQVTGMRLGASSALWNQLNQERATSICLKMIEGIQLDANGILTTQDNRLSRAILKQFIDFHRTWFDQQWAHLGSFPDEHWGGVDVYDPQEPALFLTRNLFVRDHYSKLLSGSRTAIAVRDGSTLIPSLAPEAGGFLRLSRIATHSHEGPTLNSNSITYTTESLYDETTALHLETPLVQMGEPVGINLTNYQNGPLLPVVWTDIYSKNASFQSDGISLPQAFLSNRGGGALGSVPYLILNFGHGFDYLSDGAAKLPRRYILSVFKNFLCRQGPFVRTSDVAPWKSNLAAAPAFRKSDACLRCHTTLDQSALALRNFRLAGTANTKLNSFLDYRTPPILATYNVDPAFQPLEFWPAVGDPNFHRTKPDGRLYFRSITGELINVPVDSLETLGQRLSETPDYFACAAKRYFEFFTHNKIELFDPYDPSNDTLNESISPLDREMKSFVLALGQELQSTGSLNNLIKRIIESDYYRQGNFGQ